ncbi:META domain-containing protein [Colwellia piezophila]|uniref:META domain-containing protein n=1 Tax=Colwellia piezophila TaxID=211668 RepID=UPI00036ADADB|nr:META domain-containing protein [Colwellia piezophila]
MKYSLVVILLLFIFRSDAKSNNYELSLSIEDHEWSLIQYGYQSENKSELIRGTRYTLQFDYNTLQVSGRIDCNSFSSHFTISNNKIFIEEFPITEMACGLSSLEYNQQIIFILSALSNLSIYKISNDKLLLESVRGKQLVFTTSE